ncbi:transposase [Pseudoxanthomonas sp. JBR18]|uniref:transposase n=1 Tax=Pseudoxanthomonas sp. JBR18 TaxID=2969308 RepID=UPI0023054A69|nr:transposase [Pseudoxanthomonas sp. JBR18]WCE05588.1 transposase [Pseudoxanthomonas sp. JBR18]
MHVVQRGVNRCAIFLDDEDRHHYRRLLRQACGRFGMHIHAFVLMDNHVHLFVSANQVGAVSAAMRLSGQSYVQAFNARHRLSGTLWQGRFKSCLVQTDHYALTVLRYIERNPTRARMVAHPEDYRWSSFHTHLGRALDPLVTPHAVYLNLGTNAAARAQAYSGWLREGHAQEGEDAVRRHLMQERALGDPRLQAMVECALGRPAACRARGRPRMVPQAD